ncbi:hypothetical protein [Sphingomonas bacterium]|uniref:hypothetical protein n=1 Tax=Sphingomonas bacterium TaxID=1895847 RepID=UPI0015764502|nr:hypothetical protein [Sphingomonas bacterium]
MLANGASKLVIVDADDASAARAGCAVVVAAVATIANPISRRIVVSTAKSNRQPTACPNR